MNTKQAIGAGLVITAAGDVATTYYGLEHAGLVEKNPNSLYFIETFGLWSLVPLTAVALAVTVGLAWLTHRLYGHEYPRAWYAPCLVVIALNAVVTAQNALRIVCA